MSKKNSKKTINKNIFKQPNFWKIVSGFLLLVIVVYLIVGQLNLTSNLCLKKGNKVTSFLEENYEVGNINLNSYNLENNLCKLNLNIQDQDLDVYASTEGELLFVPGLEPINMESVNENLDAETNQQTNYELEKSNKPKVELFVMSHCPYGTQIEKGILPVVDLLGDNIDFKIKFVDYVMHDTPEINEQLNQRCIDNIYGEDKYLDYLSCFLEDSDSNRCVDKFEFNETEINSCVTELDNEYEVTKKYEDKSTWVSGYYPLFDLDKEDNLKYGIQGSPSIVINETLVEGVSRDSQSLLNVICSAFTNPIEECDTNLDSSTPSPGFGYETTTNSTTTAQCS